MKTTITIILIIFSSIIGYSQTNEFGSNDAVWYYSYNYGGGLETGYYKFYINGDSVIQNHNCKILKKEFVKYSYFTHLTTTSISNHFIYEENNIVYKLFTDTFYTLYDFNAMQGDSWITYSDDSNCGTFGQIYIDSVGIKIINNDTLKTIYPHLEPYLYDTCLSAYTDEIIERIGCVGFIFPRIIGFLGDEEIGPLRCYYDNVIGWYNTNISPDCDFLTSENKINTNDRLETIYNSPNPFSDETYINYELSNNCTVSIIVYNCNGKEVVNILNKKQDKGVHSILFNSTQLPSGIYYYKIVTDKSSKISKMILAR